MDMEQQLHPKLANKTLWLNPEEEEEEEEEEEVGVDLLARHSSSRHPPNGVRAATTSSGGEPHPTNGTIPEIPDRQVEEKEDAPVTAYDGQPNQEVGGENGEGGGNSVYFDKVQGTESINESNGMQSRIIKIPSMEINHRMVKNSEDRKDFGLSPAPAEHLHEANGSFKHFENETKADDNVDLIEEIEEDLVELDVERVIDKQNTHDLYCPNCHSCITKKVILIRRRPKVSIRHKSKRGSKLDPVPNSAGFGSSDDTPEIHSDANAVATPDVQNDSREQEQEAFSCLSCFSLFIPIGNGCFKIFQFFRWGRQTENAQSTQEISRRENAQRPPEIRQREHTGSAQGTKLSENTESPQGINLSENTQSPQVIGTEGKIQSPQVIIQNVDISSTQQTNHNEDAKKPPEVNWNEDTQSSQVISTEGKVQSPRVISPGEKIQSPQGIIQNGNTETTQSPQKRIHNVDVSSPQHINHNEDAQKPQEINWNDDTRSPQKISLDANMSSSQHIKNNKDAQRAQPISCNEDKQSSLKVRSDENARSTQDINQNNSKQSPQKITTDRTNWIFSIFASHNSEKTAEKESSPVQVGHAISVQSAAVPTPSLINNGYIDGAAIKPKEPGISNIVSSTNSSLLGKLKANSTEQNPGNNEINDIETGLLEPTIHPGTDVTPLSQRTETERRGSDAGEVHEWDILKSIVYGGLIESITSLGVVSSAAGAGADTLNVLALGVANLIGGLVIICHNLKELKNDHPRIGGSSNIVEDRYQALLGRRQNFLVHVIVAILSFLIFGLVPPVVYGFSFRKSDDKDLKLAAVAGASLICIFFLALGKGHVRRPHRTYFQSVLYYIGLGITASGISYVVGQLLKKLLEQVGLFESRSTVSSSFLETVSMEVGSASY